MTSPVRASAPGKIVLCGEYAVLDGAPAICMAVDRRARVSLTAIDGNTCEVTAPGFNDKPGYFQLRDGGIHWQSGSESYAVVDAIWRAGLVDSSATRAIDLNTVEFCDAASGRKMGVGSSAALIVALCAALRNSTDIASVAMNAHVDLQGGSGSGVDVACSLNGGLIEYRMSGFAVARLRWPTDLRYRVIWTGQSASTKQQLAKLDAQDSQMSRRRLVDAAEAMAVTWRDGVASEIVDGYEAYSQCLYEFSVDHDLGIFDAGHHDLWQAARASELTYKPCGAGGGDIGIVLATEDHALDAFCDDLSNNHRVLDVRLCDTGVEVVATEATNQ